MYVTFSGIIIFVNPSQCLNALPSMLVTLSGMTIFRICLHPELVLVFAAPNVLKGIDFKIFENVTDVNASQSLKKLTPIEVTLLFITTDKSAVQYVKT